MVKQGLSVRLFTHKGEWISISAEYTNIHTAVELEKFAKSTWMKDHSNELFQEFNEIKSYVVRNWPGGCRLRTAAAAQVPIQRASLERQRRLTAERQVPPQRSRKSRVSVEAETPMTPDQERRVLFARDREEYASSLERIIARAREVSASCTSNPPTPSTPGLSTNSLGTCCSPDMSSVLDASDNEAPGAIDDNRTSKRPALSRGRRPIPKRVALGVLDPNVRRSPRSKKGNNSRYDHSEWAL